MGCVPATQRGDVLTFAAEWVELQDIVLSEPSQTRKTMHEEITTIIIIKHLPELRRVMNRDWECWEWGSCDRGWMKGARTAR